MVEIDEIGNITVTRGDTLSVPITVYNDESRQEAYRLEDGERFRFCVRKIGQKEIVYEDFISSQADDGSFLIGLAAVQTAALTEYAYIFDIALISADGLSQSTFFGGGEIKRTLKVV